MIRILQVVNIMDRAGLETMLMNYYRNIDRNLLQFDFLTHRPERGAYDDEIEKLGGKIYHAPRLYPRNYIAYLKYMKKFFGEHPEYKIVHSHIDTMSAFPLLAARLNNIPIRIVHSHSSKLDIDFKLPIKYLAKLVVPYVATHYFACGRLAGHFLYGKKLFNIVHNAVELLQFQYNEDVRVEVRKALEIDEELVVGHVGRYCYIKNQMFLLDVFCEILKSNENACLLLVGKGEDEQKLRKRVQELDVTEKVKFLIDRSDVAQLYQAMDVFVMPSLFEGVPVVGIEAQASGLPCLVSDMISDEILLTKNIQMKSLKKSASEWARHILDMNLARSREAIQELKKQGYCIEQEAEKLTHWYQKTQLEVDIDENCNDRS